MNEAPQSAAAPPPAAELRIALAPRRQRTIAALTGMCLLLSGLEAFHTGDTWLGVVGIAAGSSGVLAALRARHVGAFLRWSNALNAALLIAVAFVKIGHGKVWMPAAQFFAAAVLVAVAVFDLPKPGVLVADAEGFAVRRSRLRRRRIAWREVQGLAIDGARVRVELADGRALDIVAAMPLDDGVCARLLSLRTAGAPAR